MAESRKLTSLSSVKYGALTVIETKNAPVMLCNVEGEIYATTAICAHAGANLGEGTLSGRDITCPFHGWKFDVTTGDCSNTPGARIETYPVEIRGGDIYVTV